MKMDDALVRVLYATNNPNLGSTSRILQSWLELGRGFGLHGSVVAQRNGPLVEWLRSKSVDYLVNPMPPFSLSRPGVPLWCAGRVAVWARARRIKLLHFNEHDVYPFQRLLRKLVRLPAVCHVRYRLERDFAEWAFSGSRLPDALLWTSHQQKADSADAIAGIVPEERQHVVRLGIDVDYFGVDAEPGRQLRHRWGIGDDELMIGIPAPLRPRKRVEDFIEIIQELAPRYPNIVGIIAGGEITGDEDYRESIETRVSGSGLGRRLQWVGNLEPVEPFHHACDISVSTSEYETFGNSVCEAMACGKPVAAYAGGSVAEVVGEAGICVATKDLDSLTYAVEKMVQDSELRRRLGMQARQRVRDEFSPAASLEQLHKIYQALLSKDDR